MKILLVFQKMKPVDAQKQFSQRMFILWRSRENLVRNGQKLYSSFVHPWCMFPFTIDGLHIQLKTSRCSCQKMPLLDAILKQFIQYRSITASLVVPKLSLSVRFFDRFLVRFFLHICSKVTIHCIRFNWNIQGVLQPILHKARGYSGVKFEENVDIGVLYFNLAGNLLLKTWFLR
jgi:hypothetical protein